MKLKEFNLKVLQYSGVTDVKAEFPENLTWITDSNSDSKYNTYLSIMSSEEYEEYIESVIILPFKCYSYELLGEVILIYNEVYKLNDLPLAGNEESSKFNLDDYCIISIDKNYNIHRLIRVTDISSNVGYAEYKCIDLRDIIQNRIYYELSEGSIELSKLLVSFNENKLIKFTKGELAKKFWNAGLKLIIDKFSINDIDTSISNDISWSAEIDDEDFYGDMSAAIKKVNKFNEQFKNK